MFILHAARKLLSLYSTWETARAKFIYWMRPNVYTHMLCITSPPACLCVSASHRALWTDWLIKAAKTEDGLHCWQSTDTVLDPEKEADSPLRGPLIISPADPVCMTSICDNKCFVHRLSDIIAFCCLALCVRCLSLSGPVGLQGGEQGHCCSCLWATRTIFKKGIPWRSNLTPLVNN